MRASVSWEGRERTGAKLFRSRKEPVQRYGGLNVGLGRQCGVGSQQACWKVRLEKPGGQPRKGLSSRLPLT